MQNKSLLVLGVRWQRPKVSVAGHSRTRDDHGLGRVELPSGAKLKWELSAT
jgi:hypothetical protein